MAAPAISAARRALVVSTIAGEHETPLRMGSASYSYYYVYQAFAPLLRRWGNVVETVRPEHRLDDVLRQQPSAAIHLGFLPLDFFHPASHAPNVAFPFWDFPDLPDYSLGRDPHNDWARIANGLDLILTASEFTRDAFVRAGVRTPIHVVPVPVRPAYFEMPPWTPDQRVVIDCACYALPPAGSRAPAPVSKARRLYRERVRPRLPQRYADAFGGVAHAVGAARRQWRSVPCAVSKPLELSGIVYTSVFNPFDQRKNWPDLLTAFLLALGDCDDATLVLKLAVPRDRAMSGVNAILDFHRRLGLTHRCKVVVVNEYLTDEQMAELARGSTYYLNSSRAEGACLPLQDFLAAARPAIAPRHTAIADVFGEHAGFVAASHPEPASWPQDADGRCTTTWHRLVWTSLRDCIRESYEVAKAQPRQYAQFANGARAHMTALAGPEPVWTRLAAALDSVAPHAL
jgi:glycosyltransferase involved in cell wall biosynthesis